MPYTGPPTWRREKLRFDQVGQHLRVDLVTIEPRLNHGHRFAAQGAE